MVSYGLRLGLGTPNLHVFELTGPNRLVIDIARQRLARVRISFMHVPNYNAGRQPEIVTALRAITPSRVGQGALDAIFAGPTAGERARGLGTVRSGATGATLLRITDGVAHVRLRGGCASNGATFTVATLIMPTLKAVPLHRLRQDLRPQRAHAAAHRPPRLDPGVPGTVAASGRLRGVPRFV